MAEKALTQREVAKLAGVSYPTVNRALQGSNRVSPELRRRIQEIANRAGYRKNMSAANLVTKKTHSLGLVSQNMVYSYWGEVFKSLELGAREQGYHVVACHRETDPKATSATEISLLLERQVDGLFVVPNPQCENMSVFQTVYNAGVPLLFLEQQIPEAAGHYLGCQNYEGARDICQYLINLGHRHICHVTIDNNSHSCERRKDGYVDAMLDAGLDVNDEMVLWTDGWDAENASAVVSKILTMSPRPTAIFAFSDPMAIQLSIALRKAGVSIPRDISLGGFAGMEEGTYLTPALTSVAQPSFSLGSKAIEIMMQLIEGDEDVPAVTELPTKLLLRESCAPPRSFD